MNRVEAFAKGAHEGHEAGKHRAGQYVLGEDLLCAWEASNAHGYRGRLGAAFDQGYCYGYCLAAEGAELNPRLFREVR